MKKKQNIKPKIMIFLHTLEIGGLQLNLIKTLKHLRDEFEFYIVSFKKVNSLLENECKNYVESLTILNEEIFTLNANGRCISKIQNLIKKISPDLIESHLFFVDIKVREAAQRNNFKNVIIYQHGFGNGWDAEMRSLELKYLPYTKHYICVSKWNKNMLVKVGIPENIISVIYNGVDKEIFNRNFAFGRRHRKVDFNIGFIGRIEQSKNPLLLPDIAKRLITIHRLKKFKFHIIGKGSLAPLLKEKIRQKHLQNFFKFYGEIPHSEIPKIYEFLDLLILTSKCESMPNVIIEALINEIPVVASSIGAIPEILKHGENGFIANSSIEYAQIISHLIKKPSLYEKIKNNIKAEKNSYSQRFSLENFLTKRRNLWKKLL